MTIRWIWLVPRMTQTAAVSRPASSFFHGVILHVAVPAEDLDRVGGGPQSQGRRANALAKDDSFVFASPGPRATPPSHVSSRAASMSVAMSASRK